ncbi:Fe-S oxidoreductase [Candidatus Scalindua japonica]|uniref:Fe-S oxidoreductase n=1 Tax=Candidatus Scalindua japonica TaxID=1284222 RepID=A0A286TTH6_9BACT|nr:radical SAM protein [Candidatus Scalindua japonica]GAX59190.1 Fe-S oxidoreductase [Candidatus Scalindua japonica]
MKLIIIYPDILKGANWSGYYYTGVGYISAAAKKAGHNVSLMHITCTPDQHEFMNMLNNIISPGNEALIAFSATTNMFGFVKLWASWIKKEYKNIIIVGGVHPTLNQEETISVEAIDAICIGEGEAPLVEFMDALENGRDITGIQNIWTKVNGKVCKNPGREKIKDLDTLPFPDRAIFDYKNLDREREGIGVFMASRGCPFNCSYCCNHAIMKSIGASKGYLRFRSVDNVIKEMKQVVQDYPFIKYMHFDDDILPMNKDWFKEFSDKYSKEISLPFECNIRPNLIDENTIKLLSHSGCRTLRIGLESGNSFIRNKILNRHLSEDEIVRASIICKDAGIRLYTFNMVGMPFEDMPARLDTIKLNARINSDEEQVSIFYPYEKTKLFDICMEQGLIRKKEVTDPFKDTSLSFNRIQRNQIIFTAYYFNLLVRNYKFYFKLPESLSKIIIKISDGLFSSRIIALTVFPTMNSFVRFLSKNKRLEEFARKVKHTILNSSTVTEE